MLSFHNRMVDEMPDDDWQCFIDIEGGTPTVADPNPYDEVVRKPQPAYKIDGSLVNPLAFLPASVASDPSSLGLRNLIRGNDVGLPSGQAVAEALDRLTSSPRRT